MLQAAAVVVFAMSVRADRVVRRVFVALGILIAADGVALLLVAVIVR